MRKHSYLAKYNNSKGVRFLSILFLCMTFLTATASICGQKPVIVKGRVVDETGLPLKGAKVCLILPPCKTCLDNLIPCLTTEQEGQFYLDAQVHEGALKGILYIEGELPIGFRLIHDPSIQLSKISQYKGIEFDVASDGFADVGDVKPTVTYSAFTVDASKYVQAIYDLPNVLTFQVRDLEGNNITKKQTIARKYWTNSTSIDLFLPRGKWVLNIEHLEAKQASGRPSLLVDTTSACVKISEWSPVK